MQKKKGNIFKKSRSVSLARRERRKPVWRPTGVAMTVDERDLDPTGTGIDGCGDGSPCDLRPCSPAPRRTWTSGWSIPSRRSCPRRTRRRPETVILRLGTSSWSLSTVGPVLRDLANRIRGRTIRAASRAGKIQRSQPQVRTSLRTSESGKS